LSHQKSSGLTFSRKNIKESIITSSRLSGITEKRTTDMRATTFVTTGAAGGPEGIDGFRK
jgi:hypothetical protein